MPPFASFEKSEAAQGNSGDGQRNLADWSRARLLVAASLISALLIYIPSFFFGFVHDDRQQIMLNPFIRSWSFLPYFFTHHIWVQVDPARTGSYYRPLFMAVLIATGKLLGVRPWAFHLVSILLYLPMPLAVFFLARELGLSRVGAGWAALLFAVHPAHLEAVAWVSGMSETLMALPVTLALACYLRARRSGSKLWFAAAAAFYLLALLAKETAVVFPALAILAEFLPRGSGKKAFILRASVLIAETGIYLAVRTAFLGGVARKVTLLSSKTILVTIPSVMLFYLRHLIFPVNLSFFYDSYYVYSAASGRFLFPLSVLLLIAAALAAAWNRGWLTDTELLAAAGIFCCLLPVLDFRLFFWREIAHDRYLYLSSIFFAIFLASLIQRTARLHAVMLTALVVCLLLESEAQVWQYRNEFTLFAHAAEVAPNNVFALGGFAQALLNRGRRSDAESVLQRMVILAPGWWDPHFALGQLKFEDGRLAEAELLLEQAIALDPKPEEQHYFLAQIMRKQGRGAEAAEQMSLADRAKGDSEPPKLNPQ